MLNHSMVNVDINFSDVTLIQFECRCMRRDKANSNITKRGPRQTNNFESLINSKYSVRYSNPTRYIGGACIQPLWQLLFTRPMLMRNLPRVLIYGCLFSRTDAKQNVCVPLYVCKIHPPPPPSTRRAQQCNPSIRI